MCGKNIGNFLIPALTGVLVADNVTNTQVVERSISRPAPAIACPTCQAELLPTFTWCPHCGQALRAHPCAYCGRLLKPEEHNCPSCGAPGNNR